MRIYFIAAPALAGILAFKPFQAANKPATIPPAAAGKAETAPRPVKENIVAYNTRDERMNAAKGRAREMLPRFLELIGGNAPGVYAVKFPLPHNGATEHIWLQV